MILIWNYKCTCDMQRASVYFPHAHEDCDCHDDMMEKLRWTSIHDESVHQGNAYGTPSRVNRLLFASQLGPSWSYRTETNDKASIIQTKFHQRLNEILTNSQRKSLRSFGQPPAKFPTKLQTNLLTNPNEIHNEIADEIENKTPKRNCHCVWSA